MVLRIVLSQTQYTAAPLRPGASVWSEDVSCENNSISPLTTRLPLLLHREIRAAESVTALSIKIFRAYSETK